jgi:hypothetical protein
MAAGGWRSAPAPGFPAPPAHPLTTIKSRQVEIDQSHIRRDSDNHLERPISRLRFSGHGGGREF